MTVIHLTMVRLLHRHRILHLLLEHLQREGIEVQEEVLNRRRVLIASLPMERKNHPLELSLG